MKTLIIALVLILSTPAFAVEYFVGTLAECQAVVAKLDTLLGYPNAATKTLTYGKCRKHENRANTHYVIIKEVWAPKLDRVGRISDIDSVSSVDEKSKRISRTTLDAEGAFP